MTYLKWKKNGQKSFDELPIFFAFGRDQFKQAMEARGLTENDTDKIYRLGDTGGFYLKSDADIVKAYFEKKDDLPGLMNDHDFAVDAFYYEMGNHEYHINYQGDWDVCSCFCHCDYGSDKDYADYLKDGGYSDEVIGFYKEAKKKFYKDCDEKGWW